MLSVYKTGYFESAHKLEGHPKCGKLHGHSYKYEVWIEEKYRNVTNDQWFFVLDFHEIKEYFNQFDHSDSVIDVSAETIAIRAWDHFAKKLKSTSKVKVRIWETSTSYAEYYD
jgi:6-pyruvoyltetrahydropterin/6-carboxytetrahydropterin synthase